jgi:hypothetical protein
LFSPFPNLETGFFYFQGKFVVISSKLQSRQTSLYERKITIKGLGLEEVIIVAVTPKKPSGRMVLKQRVVVFGAKMSSVEG